MSWQMNILYQHQLLTVDEHLKVAVYRTALVGKWGLGYPGSEGEPIPVKAFPFGE